MAWWTEHVVPRVTDAALRGPALARARGRTCTGLHGRVLELGFGSGLNLQHLPPEVTEVGAVEPSDLAWRMSESRRASSDIAVERIGLDGGAVRAPDASYDSALCTFTLCTVPDALAALAEVRRLVRRGGELHFLEHGLADDERTRSWQRRLEPFQRRLAGGCHLTRDPSALVEEAGMTITSVQTGVLEGVGGPAALTFGYRGSATV